MDENQQQEEERKQNLVDRINSGVNKYRNFKRARSAWRGGRSLASTFKKSGAKAAGNQLKQQLGKQLAKQAASAAGRQAATAAVANPVGLIVAIVILVIFILIMGAGANSGSQPAADDNGGGGFGPGGGVIRPGGLDYSIPMRDSTVTPLDLKDLIKRTWPNAQTQNWDTIVSQSVANGWNPALVLALWFAETQAQNAPGYTDPLGCGVSEPTTDISISLGCLFSHFSQFTNDQYNDFLCTYAIGHAPCDFGNNSDPRVIKSWYAQLVPDGPGALVEIPPGGIGPGSDFGKALAQNATSLVQAIDANCPGGRVLGSNYSCIQSHMPVIPYPVNALNEIVQSATINQCSTLSDTCLQCVGFVRASVAGTSGSSLNNGGNAKDYATNIPTGYALLSASDNIEVGDLAIKTGGSWGHIAVVTNVYGTTSFDVAEANFDVNGGVKTTTTSKAVWDAYIRKQ